jgi:hypothetical protein
MNDESRIPALSAYWVYPQHLMAGQHPGSWDEDMGRKNVLALLDAGFTTFIDLTEPGQAWPYNLTLMQETVRRGSMAHYMRFPIAVPDEDLVLRVLDRIDQGIARSEVVYLHCQAGQGRTGVIVGCWMVRHGLSGDDALKAIARLRGDGRPSPETAAQAQFVLNWPRGR